MLPRAHRLRRSAEFGHVVRRGVRAATPSLVLHEWIRGDSDPVRVGFVVGRSAGNAVHRNRLRRQLQHLMAARLDDLPAHSSLVVRTNAAVTGSTVRCLGMDLDTCLATLARRRGSTPKALS